MRQEEVVRWRFCIPFLELRDSAIASAAARCRRRRRRRRRHMCFIHFTSHHHMPVVEEGTSNRRNRSFFKQSIEQQIGSKNECVSHHTPLVNQTAMANGVVTVVCVCKTALQGAADSAVMTVTVKLSHCHMSHVTCHMSHVTCHMSHTSHVTL